MERDEALTEYRRVLILGVWPARGLEAEASWRVARITTRSTARLASNSDFNTNSTAYRASRILFWG